MRRAIRAARKDSTGPVAVVCGAWHVPALDVAADASPTERDAATSGGSPR